MATLNSDDIRKQVSQAQTFLTRFAASVAPGTLWRLLLAFGLAFGLWIYVIVRDNPDVSRPLLAQTVEVRGSPSSLILMQQTLPTVDVTIAGPQGLVTAASQSATAYIDLSGRTAGSGQRVPIKVTTAPGVRWSVRPEDVIVDLEPVSQIEVPVSMAVPVPTLSNVRLDQPTIEPRVVTISGARATLNEIQRVVVRPELTGDPNDLTRVVRPVPLDSNGHEVLGPRLEVSPSAVKVTLPAKTATGVKTVPIKLVLNGQLRDGFKIDSIKMTPEVASITGEAVALQAINAIETEILDIANRQQSLDRQVRLKSLPDNIKAETDIVRVEITISPILTRQTITLPIVTRPRPGLRALTVPTNVAVTLQGPVPRIRELDVGALRAEVDVQNLGPGIHSVEPKIIGPGLEGIERLSLQPSHVSVQITADPTATPAPAPTPTRAP